MTFLLNGDFSAWNQGTLFQSPAVNTQLADHWFAGAGQSGHQQYERDGAGPFAMGVARDATFPFSPGAKEFYQDVVAAPLTGKSAVASIDVSYPGGAVPTVSITMTDGFNTYTFSDSVGAFGTLTVTGFISPFATNVRITVHCGDATGLVDFANALLNLTAHNVSLAESVTQTEAFPTSPTKVLAEVQASADSSSRGPIKAISDSMLMVDTVAILKSLGLTEDTLMNDWVEITVNPANRWTEVDN